MKRAPEIVKDSQNQCPVCPCIDPVLWTQPPRVLEFRKASGLSGPTPVQRQPVLFSQSVWSAHQRRRQRFVVDRAAHRMLCQHLRLPWSRVKL